MVKLGSPDTSKQEAVLEALNTRGELSTQELAAICNLSYFQVRRALEKLMEEDKLHQSRRVNKTIYFASKESTAMPTFNANEGFVSLNQLMYKVKSDEPFFKDNSEIVKSFLANIYVQPIHARAKAAIDESELDKWEGELDVAIKRAENSLALLRDLRGRLSKQSVDLFTNWFNDENYSAKTALKIYSKVFDNDYHIAESYNQLQMTGLVPSIDPPPPVGETNENNNRD